MNRVARKELKRLNKELINKKVVLKGEKKETNLFIEMENIREKNEIVRLKRLTMLIAGGTK